MGENCPCFNCQDEACNGCKHCPGCITEKGYYCSKYINCWGGDGHLFNEEEHWLHNMDCEPHVMLDDEYPFEFDDVEGE
jgi:hypothetical protein